MKYMLFYAVHRSIGRCTSGIHADADIVEGSGNSPAHAREEFAVRVEAAVHTSIARQQVDKVPDVAVQQGFAASGNDDLLYTVREKVVEGLERRPHVEGRRAALEPAPGAAMIADVGRMYSENRRGGMIGRIEYRS